MLPTPSEVQSTAGWGHRFGACGGFPGWSHTARTGEPPTRPSLKVPPTSQEHHARDHTWASGDTYPKHSQHSPKLRFSQQPKDT